MSSTFERKTKSIKIIYINLSAAIKNSDFRDALVGGCYALMSLMSTETNGFVIHVGVRCVYHVIMSRAKMRLYCSFDTFRVLGIGATTAAASYNQRMYTFCVFIVEGV